MMGILLKDRKARMKEDLSRNKWEERNASKRFKTKAHAIQDAQENLLAGEERLHDFLSNPASFP
jgi:hypothetical protein